MSFLSLMAALLLEQWRPLRAVNPVYTVFGRYIQRIAQSFNAGQYRDGVISWLLTVAPIALFTWGVYVLLFRVHVLLALAWNVGVLYLVLGFRHFSHFFNDVLLALRANDLPKAREMLAVWGGVSAAELTETETARVALELGFVRSHRDVFGVIAWFVIFGAAGAIAYRLASLLNDRWHEAPQAADSKFGEFAGRAFAAIDWLPVRLTAMAFGVAGDFMGAVEAWREQAAAWKSRSEGILLAAAAGALGVRLGGVLHRHGAMEYRPQLGDGDEADVDYMRAAIGLIWRALVLWMFLILLATIASWF